jgi:hypothetical protein
VAQRLRSAPEHAAWRTRNPPRIRASGARKSDGNRARRHGCVDSRIHSGTRGARSVRMASRLEPWTIPFHVIMWITFTVGLIMTIVVVLMR